MMGYVVMYIACVLVWGFGQHELVSRGLWTVPPGQSRAYLLGGAAVLMGVLLLLGNAAADRGAQGDKGAALWFGLVGGVILVGLLFFGFGR
jgi:hypothetical protein